jgi:hypothetical protein
MLDWFNLRDVLAWISEQDSGLGLLLVGGGLILLVYGWRLRRFMIAVSLTVMGGVLAGCLGPDGGIASLAVPAGGALVAGLVGFRTTRLAVALAAGGWASTLMLACMVRLGAASEPTIIMVAIVFVAVAALACAAIPPSVAFVTSVEGTILVLAGAMILLADCSSWWSAIRDAVEGNPIFLPFILIAGSVTGYYVQLTDMQEKDTGLAIS